MDEIDMAVQMILGNGPAPWQHPKPCAVCRVEFVPMYHWQECCYQHQAAFRSVPMKKGSQ